MEIFSHATHQGTLTRLILIYYRLLLFLLPFLLLLPLLRFLSNLICSDCDLYVR